MQQGDEDPAAGGADRVAEGNGAAVDVDLAALPAQGLANRQRLNGKRLVSLN